MTKPRDDRSLRIATVLLRKTDRWVALYAFTKVISHRGEECLAACFAMICHHHCGTRYIEFFPNAKQENLFIGMIHAFMYMGIPRYVLTDNMKSVVIRRDLEDHPLWQKDYESFMKTAGF